MTGMSVNEFINKVYYGDEIEFKYHETMYLVQGFYDNNYFHIIVDYWNNTDGSEPEHDYLLDVFCKSAQERVECFKTAKIFNGKTFYEIEKEIEVLFG